MKGNLIAYIGFLLFLSWGCEEKNAVKDINKSNAALLSPIRLDSTASIVPTSDYVLDVASVQSIACSDGYSCQLANDKKTIQISTQPSAPFLGNITLTTDNNQFDILLIKSQKTSKEFMVSDPNKKYKSVELVGDMTAWKGVPMTYNNGQWSVVQYLQPGQYGYQLSVDGERILDPSNPKQLSNGIGGYNSELNIPKPPASALPFIALTDIEDSQAIINSNKSNTKFMAYLDNTLVNTKTAAKLNSIIDLASKAKTDGRSYLRVYGYNDQGLSNDLFIPLEDGEVVTDADELNRFDFHTQIMYFLMVDRFHNANTSNDAPEDDPEIHPLANHHGGDLLGVQEKLEDGYFEKLGVNTIWLSPILRNPKGAYGLWDKGGVRSKFSAYHGYWPISFTKIDERFGSDKDLKTLVETAHEHDDNVILDFVANHVHEEHPVYQANKNNNWATNLHLPDGSLNTERWDEHRLTTWFDVFLPTLNLEKDEITEMLSDSAVFLLEEYNLDGFRHDATKHIPLKFWRTLTKKVKAHNDTRGNPVYQIGETYGSPELIASYLGSGVLDGQFDFNMYDAIVAAIVSEADGLDRVAQRLNQSFQYYGHNHVMGNMTGNQDKTRFISLASGDVKLNEDSKLAGWTRDISLRTKASFDKLAMMHAINLTIPGIPCIYYGDEIGMAGGNDPDNRKMMRFDNLNDDESKLFEIVSELTALRRDEMPLMYGNFEIIESSKDQLVYKRSYLDDQIIFLANTANSNHTFTLPVSEEADVDCLEFNGDCAVSENEIKITLPPNTFEIININTHE